MVFIRALEEYVKELNSIYCTKTKNYLVIRSLYGNTQVSLTGKTPDAGLKLKYFGITNGFADPIKTLKNLIECEKYGWLRNVINRCERRN